MRLLLLSLFMLSIAFANGKTEEKLADGIYAKIVTDKGNILIKLEHEKAPMTVANFVGLAEGNFKPDTLTFTKPYYDGLKFHRVIADFMIQAGDPLGNGSGGPGYAFPDEIDTTLKHDAPGILSMANAGPRTNGSQFFITHKATPWLDGKHTVFGRLIEGQDVVNAIQQNDIIQKIEIIRVGKLATKFNATEVFNSKVKEYKDAEIAATKKRIETFRAEIIADYPNAKQTESGLMYQISKEGNGTYPMPGQTVEVHYSGFFPNGSKFDSSVDRNSPLKFVLGKGQVIKGWDEGIALLSEAKLMIPYWLGYGEAGRSVIPPKATLIFDVQLIGIG